jgi:nucleotide-binding universal stress UspA family protein
MPPMLRWALRRLPLREDEKARLEREAFEATGFVTNLERLLLAADKSAAGAFASRLVGLLVGSRGMPVTVLQFGSGPPQVPEHQSAMATLTAFAETTKKAAPAQTAPAQVEVVERVQTMPAEEAVASEARKGYDLLVIGVEPTVAPEGGFHPDVARMARGFEGPLAVAVARGMQVEDPLRTGLDILVPVTGTEVSRRGAEVALVLARATNASVMALYVTNAARGMARRRAGRSRRGGEEILKDIASLADRYDVPVRTAMRVDLAAEDAILRQARLGGHDLIVMGVTRRPGETLSFGDVATAVLESSERSVLYVAS